MKGSILSKLLIVAIMVSSIGVAMPAVYADASYVVDSLADDADANAGDGNCATAGGECTLRAAVEEINAQAPATFDISFGVTGTITLGSAWPAGGMPRYTTIQGPGAEDLIIDFNGFDGLGFGGGEWHILDGVTLTGASNSCVDFNEGGAEFTHSVISNTIITDCGSHGIEITSAGWDMGYVDILNNTIYNTQDEAITVSTVDNANISNIVISGNTIYDFGLEGTSWKRNAIEFYETGAFAISNVTVSNNIVTGHADDAAIIADTNGGGHVISGNEVTGGIHGIRVTNSGGATVSGNTLDNQVQFGVVVANGSSVTVDDNTINTPTIAGVFVGGSTGHIVSNNSVNNSAGFGIFIQNSNANTVSGNTIDTPGGYAGIAYLNSDNNTSSGNTVLNSAGSGIQMGGGNDPTKACTGNTFTNETLTGNLYGFTIGDSEGTDNNTLSSSVITESVDYDIINTSPGADTLYVVDTTFDATKVGISADSIVDVTFNAAPRATHNGFALQGVSVIATQTATATETDMGTTDAGGYASTIVNYQIDAETAGLNYNEFSFELEEATYGTASIDATTLSKTNLSPAATEFSTPVYVDNFYASYTPINIDDVDYNDRLVYTWSLDDDGQEVSADGTIIEGADGQLEWDFATVSITGGDFDGENWTIVTRQDVFSELADLQTWLDQHTDVGAGNYTVTNNFYDNPDANIVEENGPYGDYVFNLPGAASVAEGGTDPGFLMYSNSNFYSSASPLTVDGVAYNEGDSILYIGHADDLPHTADADDTRITIADGENGFEIVLFTITAGEVRYTSLFRIDNFPDLTSVSTWFDLVIGDGNYTIDYETLGDGEADVRANGFTNNYSFELPVFGDAVVSVTDGMTTPPYLTEGGGPEPEVTLTADTETLNENEGGTVTVTATLSEVSDRDIIVYIVGTGTATFLEDFSLADLDFDGENTFLTIAAGELSASYTGTIIDDVVYEGNETSGAYIDYAVNAAVGTPSSVMMTIVENDAAPEPEEPEESTPTTTGGIVITPPAEEPGEIEVPEEPGETPASEPSEEEKAVIEQSTRTIGNAVSSYGYVDPKVREEKKIKELLTSYKKAIAKRFIMPTEEGQKLIELIKRGGSLEEMQKARKSAAKSIREAIGDFNKRGKLVKVYDNSSSKSVTINDVDNVEVIVAPLYTDKELNEAVKEAEAAGSYALVVDGNSDYDNDYVSDLAAVIYDIPLFNPDADNDGYSNAEEIYLGTDPNKKEKAPTVPMIVNLDGQTVGAWPSIRVSGQAGDEVEVLLIEEAAATGSAEELEYISLGSTAIDAKNKGEINLDYPLKNGTYYALPSGVAGYGEAVKFVVDDTVTLDNPRFVSIEDMTDVEQAMLRLGFYTEIVIDYWDENSEKFEAHSYISKLVDNVGGRAIIVRGYAEPNTVVYLTYKSVILSSVVLSDASGYFETVVYEDDLSFEEDHTVIGYAQDVETGAVSNASKSFISRLKNR